MHLIYNLFYTLPFFLIIWFLIYINMNGVKDEIRSLKLASFIGLLKYISVVWYGTSPNEYPPSLSMIQGGLTVILIIVTFVKFIFKLADKISDRRKL